MKKKIKIGITGHSNIEKCFHLNDSNSYIYNKIAFKNVFDEIELFILDYIKNNKFDDITFISGMARGVDEIFALIAIKNNFKLIICVPKDITWYKEKKIKNNLKIQALNFNYILKYNLLLKIIESTDNYNKGNYGYFLSRNEDIVNQSDVIFSYKKYESEGTNDCINRALKHEKYKGNI